MTPRILALLYHATVLGISILFVVELFRHRRAIRPYLLWGVGAGGTFLLLSVLTALAGPDPESASRWPFLVANAFGFIRLLACTSVGLYCWRKVTSEDQTTGILAKTPGGDVSICVCLASTLGVCVGTILFSSGFLWWAKPEFPAAILELQQGSDPFEVDAFGLLFLLAIALSEEIFFRVGLLSYLIHGLKPGPYRYWVPIVATSFLWAIAHVGMLEPGWVKPLQIFPIGIILGWLCVRCGPLSCITAHVVFNIAMAYLARPIMGL